MTQFVLLNYLPAGLNIISFEFFAFSELMVTRAARAMVRTPFFSVSFSVQGVVIFTKSLYISGECRCLLVWPSVRFSLSFRPLVIYKSWIILDGSLALYEFG